MNDAAGEPYEVRGTDNKLFCKCRDEGGEKILETGDGHTIAFSSLQRQVFGPHKICGRPPRGTRRKKVV